MRRDSSTPSAFPWPFSLPPSAFLLIAQLLLLVLYAIYDRTTGQHAVINAINVVILVLVVWVINHSPSSTWLNWVLTIPAVGLAVLSIFIQNELASTLSSLFEALLYLYAVVSQIIYMLSDETVTRDELFAIGATFTLLGWSFAHAYLVCQAWVPGSFISSVVVDRPLTFIELLSLSFTNLTATGLSDILPGSAWARVLILLEQSVGVGYVAIVVSRLVGLLGQKRKKKIDA